MMNLIFSILQQECKQESENLDKGRTPRKKIAPSPEWRTVSRIFISGPWQVCVWDNEVNNNVKLLFALLLC